jgi:hypothetical protein
MCGGGTAYQLPDILGESLRGYGLDVGGPLVVMPGEPRFVR